MTNEPSKPNLTPYMVDMSVDSDYEPAIGEMVRMADGRRGICIDIHPIDGNPIVMVEGTLLFKMCIEYLGIK